MPLNSGGIEGGVVPLGKHSVALKWGKIISKLLLMTYRKSHMRFRLVSKSTTLDDLEGPLRTEFGALKPGF